MTFVLGLTGGIATGKSTADSFFKKKKIPVVDADKIAHHIYDPAKPAYNAILAKFSQKLLDSENRIDRKKLGQLVFTDPIKLRQLNAIVQPFIYQEIDQQLNFYRQQSAKIVVLDAPVLYETNGQGRCDKVLVINLPYPMQLKRLMARNGLNEAAAKARIKSQMPLVEKVARADYVVDNTGTIESLEDKLQQVLLQIKAEG